MDDQDDGLVLHIEVSLKSTEKSTSLRLKGNNLLKEKSRHSKPEHKKILFLYSKCIAYAPDGSEELAFGYGNRAFLLAHLKKYHLSIIDIDRALKISKSNVLKAKLLCRKIAALKLMNEPISESIINEAQRLFDAIKTEAVKIQLKELLEDALNKEIDSNYYKYENGNLPHIDFDMELPATSNAIRMEYDQQFGRHYRANRNISAGEVLIIEQAYAAVPLSKQLYLACSFCLNVTWNGIPCKHCPCVFYCSEKCKEAAWESYHDLECPILVLIFKRIYDE